METLYEILYLINTFTIDRSQSRIQQHYIRWVLPVMMSANLRNNIVAAAPWPFPLAGLESRWSCDQENRWSGRLHVMFDALHGNMQWQVLVCMLLNECLPFFLPAPCVLAEDIRAEGGFCIFNPYSLIYLNFHP